MKNNQPRGRFITLEGIEGVGKSTQLAFIADYLKQKHIPVITTHEPGGTQVAEAIRKLVLQSTFEPESIIPESELLLFFAARAQHIHYMIKPLLQQGNWVVCDRFTEASYAYQGGGRGIEPRFIRCLQEYVQKDLKMDAVLLLDAPVEQALSRTRHRQYHDRIETEKYDFFNRVRSTYLERAQQIPSGYHIIDASLALPDVQNQIKAVLEKLLYQWGAYE